MGEVLQTRGAAARLLATGKNLGFDLDGIECDKIVFALCCCVSG
jgi:hypothetical protein